MELNVGILTIGSLYWDEGRRKDWRAARLSGETEYTVTAPIRYGRKSRGGTYTTVFSASAPMGTAKVLCCKNPITSADQLIAEAEFLWMAERLSDRANHKISAAWGCVALLVNPAAAIPKSVISGWDRHVRQAQDYGRVPQGPGEEPLVGDNGLLQLSWPTLAGQNAPVPVDLLLATVTHPTLEGDTQAYATAETIAAGWGADTTDEIRYFRNNRTHSIRTFQDEAILAELRKNFPAIAATIA